MSADLAISATALPDGESPRRTPYDDLLLRATDRLSGDPELQQEVRQELLAHLEDAAAEHQAAGAPTDQAVANARAALGDPNDLAQRFWEIHHRRLRFRRAAKWVLGVALVPTAIAVTLAAVWSGLLTVAVATRFNAERGTAAFSWADRFARASIERRLSQLSPDDRLVVSAGLSPFSPTEDAALKTVVDRWPDNPIYYANYINLRYEGVVGYERKALDSATAAAASLDSASAASFFAELDRGEKLEPQNGLYNLLKASLLFRQSSRLVEDPKLLAEELPQPHALAMDRPSLLDRVKVFDQPMFDRGLEQLRLSWSKPRITIHSDEIVEERLRLMPHAGGLDGLLPILPLLTHRVLNMGSEYEAIATAGAHALQLAERSADPATGTAALEWIDGINRLADKIGAERAESWAPRWMAPIAMQYRIKILRALRRPDEAAAARQSWVDLQKQREELGRMRWKAREKFSQAHTASVRLDGINMEDAESKITPASLVRAEYALSDRLAVGVLLTLLSVIATWLLFSTAIRAFLSRWNAHRRSAATPHPAPLHFVFIGWRRLARIGLLSVLLPLAAYALWSRLTPFGGRRAGLGVTIVRVMIEYCIVASVILALLWRLTRAGIRARAAELGLPTPPPTRRWRTGLLAFVGIASNLLAVALLFLVLGKRFSYYDVPNPALLRWVWIPCAVPLAWIVAAILRRRPRFGGSVRLIVCGIIALAPTLMISDQLESGAEWMARYLGLPVIFFYLLAAGFAIAPVVLWLLTFFGVGRPAVDSRAYAPFRRLMAASSIPALGTAILLLAVMAALPLRRAEAAALRAANHPTGAPFPVHATSLP